MSYDFTINLGNKCFEFNREFCLHLSMECYSFPLYVLLFMAVCAVFVLMT